MTPTESRDLVKFACYISAITLKLFQRQPDRITTVTMSTILPARSTNQSPDDMSRLALKCGQNSPSHNTIATYDMQLIKYEEISGPSQSGHF